MTGEEEQPTGVWSRAGRLGQALLLALKNRIEILGLELREEQARVVRLLMQVAGMVFFAFLGLLFLSLAVVVALRSHAVWVLLGFGALYGGLALVAARSIRRAWLEGPAPFQETLNELNKDIECLTSRK
jgi:uncharacterized membrane protein YqjE